MGKTHLVPPLDAGWLWLESDTNLMHGSILCFFEPPPGEPDYVDRLIDRMRGKTTPVAPFDRRVKPGWSRRLAPRWELVDEIDTDYHLRRVTLDEPGGQRELGEIVSLLHGTPLDRSRPPWTIDVIDGLEDGRFAILGRMHHALADGVSALRIVEWWLSESADDSARPIWAYRRPKRRSRPAEDSSGRIRGTLGALRGLAGWLPSTLNATRHALTGVSARPWSAPRSALNAPITSRRRVSTQSLELARFSALSETTSTTINDVVLAVCAGGLRRYLKELGELPTNPLVTNIPVSVRAEDRGAAGGNAISWAMVGLGTQIEEPRERLEAIRSATVDAKRRLRGISDGTIDTYTLLAVTPILIEQLTRLGGRVPPLFNVPISNVPGPRKQLYLGRARLDELHALTVIYGGYALNIVAVSYGEQLQMSFTACPDVLPHSQRLAVLCGEALEELERAYAAPV